MYPQGLLQAADVNTLILHSFEKRMFWSCDLSISNRMIKYLKGSIFLRLEREERPDSSCWDPGPRQQGRRNAHPTPLSSKGYQERDLGGGQSNHGKARCLHSVQVRTGEQRCELGVSGEV